MEKARLAGVLALAVVTAVTVGAEFPKTAAQRQEAAEYRAILEAAPLAQVEGEAQSPNGQFRVETAGRTDQYVSGWIVPESIQITEVPTGRVLWQMPGQLTQRGASHLQGYNKSAKKSNTRSASLDPRKRNRASTSKNRRTGMDR